MLENTRQSIYFGVGCVLTPQPVFDAEHSLRFQQELAKQGLTFNAASTPLGWIILQRAAPPLEVRLQQPGPPVGTLVTTASLPERTLEEFTDEAKMVLEAFKATWEGRGQVQVIQREITIRHLYDVAAEHAFQYLWEQRLGGTEQELGAFGRKVGGGGLRFVMPPADLGSGDPGIEVKIESFLANPKKLFVELQMKWFVPGPLEDFDPASLLEEGQGYASKEIVAFIGGGQE